MGLRCGLWLRKPAWRQVYQGSFGLPSGEGWGQSIVRLEQGGLAERFGADVGKQRAGLEDGGAVGLGGAERGEGDEVTEEDGGVFHVGGVEAGGGVAEQAGGLAEVFPLALEGDVGVAGEVQGQVDALRTGVGGGGLGGLVEAEVGRVAKAEEEVKGLLAGSLPGALGDKGWGGRGIAEVDGCSGGGLGDELTGEKDARVLGAGGGVDTVDVA